MLTLEQVRAGLKCANLVDVSEYTDINYQMICRINRGEYDPERIAYHTVKRISDYLLSDHYLQQMNERAKAHMDVIKSAKDALIND